jgi:hypothetical protein
MEACVRLCTLAHDCSRAYQYANVHFHARAAQRFEPNTVFEDV